MRSPRFADGRLARGAGDLPPGRAGGVRPDRQAPGARAPPRSHDGNARDFFLEARYFLVPSSYLELNYDRTTRSFPGPAREERKRLTAGLVAWVTENVRAEGKVAYDRFSDEGGVSGRDGSNKSIELSAAYQYR